MSMDEVITRYLLKEIEKLKSSTPKHRRSLRELIEADEAYVITNDGLKIVFEKSELVEFSRYVPERYWDKILLPIIVARDPDMGPGTFEVIASPIEKRILSKILEIEGVNEESKLILRVDHVEKLLKKFKTLIHIVILFRTNTPYR